LDYLSAVQDGSNNPATIPAAAAIVSNINNALGLIESGHFILMN
jgi:hypothetical protein